ncbi:group I truncated hemoglobin [Ideonella livida]|uniref:Group 1 truncated hemoglobin n=1 Tax=Ideonella livida TaxID=2707176 RepID=A0A7C9PKR5_9BURK|nr:group 1 truncated hemoglobin [Ideonella livida]NDY93690.1 group 1 truncated hemoglobin [Ideonella livida]
MIHAIPTATRTARARALSALLAVVASLGVSAAQATQGAQGAQPAPQATSAPAAAPADPLFQQLGGQAGIRAVVTDLVQRAAADPRIGHFFAQTQAEHLIDALSQQVCQVSGGPCRYQGPDMRTAHQDMGVRPADFNALVELLQGALQARGIAFSVQNRLLARLAPMHRDIVEVGP